MRTGVVTVLGVAGIGGRAADDAALDAADRRGCDAHMHLYNAGHSGKVRSGQRKEYGGVRADASE